MFLWVTVTISDTVSAPVNSSVNISVSVLLDILLIFSNVSTDWFCLSNSLYVKLICGSDLVLDSVLSAETELMTLKQEATSKNQNNNFLPHSVFAKQRRREVGDGSDPMALSINLNQRRRSCGQSRRAALYRRSVRRCQIGRGERWSKQKIIGERMKGRGMQGGGERRR